MAEPFRIPPLFAEKVDQLVRDFEQSEDFFLSDSYPEHQARIDFIDPLFEALGWAIALRPGENPYERDVIVERGPTTGRPDYNFRISGQTKFYVEAKAPSVALSRSDVILQAKKYAWNNTDQFVYFVVVTDFQEIRFYDASRKPDPRHPDAGLIFKHDYRSYLHPQVARDIWQLSREAVQSGSLDKLLSPVARSARQKTPLDVLFLGDLSSWREQLAKAVFKVHLNFSPADLNSAVQVMLDRLIFIRIAEDRGALPPNRLRDMARTWRDERTQHPISADLFPLFREVNQDLNGEIFKPHLCERVTWDSSLIAEIILSGLEPYNFAQIGVELLGSIYERYLGKTIRVTAKRAIVEDKPEVRKAGGVYYTPSYVVKYIVANTLGQLIAGKTPAQIARLRILDPACGSGSFLLAAYQMLLDYHLEWYKHHPKQVADEAQLALFKENGDWRLSLREKARILTNNIYGVDIDPQAVEIAMMSLYIRLLEGEKGLPHKKRLLPALASNIKCGNSLIPPELVHKHLFPSDEPVTRATPFDWSSKREGFGQILAEGGFHVVIGNPPYVRPHNIPPEIKKMLWALYSTFVAKSDQYSCFMERALTLTRPNGLFSFIVPQTWTSLESFTKIRSFIIRNARVLKLVQLPKKVFAQATVETCIFVFQRTKDEPSSPNHLIHVEKLEPPGLVPNFINIMPYSDWLSGPIWGILTPSQGESHASYQPILHPALC